MSSGAWTTSFDRTGSTLAARCQLAPSADLAALFASRIGAALVSRGGVSSMVQLRGDTARLCSQLGKSCVRTRCGHTAPFHATPFVVLRLNRHQALGDVTPTELPVLLQPSLIRHWQLTDAYLLGLTQRAGQRVAPLDRRLLAFAESAAPSVVNWIAPR